MAKPKMRKRTRTRPQTIGVESECQVWQTTSGCPKMTGKGKSGNPKRDELGIGDTIVTVGICVSGPGEWARSTLMSKVPISASWWEHPEICTSERLKHLIREKIDPARDMLSYFVGASLLACQSLCQLPEKQCLHIAVSEDARRVWT